MKAFVIASQDISSLQLALVEGKKLLHQAAFSVAPEQHLASVHEALETWGVDKRELDEVWVVTGPGSFTASRVSTTIANTLAWTLSIPVRGVENESERSLEELISSFLHSMPSQEVNANYNRPPFITKPKTSS